MEASEFDKEITPHQLMKKYPQLENLSWNASRIGTFHSAGLLLGEKNKIYLPSFHSLIEFVNQSIMKSLIDLENRKNYDLFTAEDLLIDYPKVISKLHWNDTKLGIFLTCKLLRGKKNVKENRSTIDKESFEELIRFANLVNKQRNVDL